MRTKQGPKRGPNRSIDAEGVRKPLGWLLERSWRPLEPQKTSLEASWSHLGALKIAAKRPEGDRPEVGGGMPEVKGPSFTGPGPGEGVGGGK